MIKFIKELFKKHNNYEGYEFLTKFQSEISEEGVVEIHWNINQTGVGGEFFGFFDTDWCMRIRDRRDDTGEQTDNEEDMNIYIRDKYFKKEDRNKKLTELLK